MAIIIGTGTSNSQVDFLTKLRDFVSFNLSGLWTMVEYSAVGDMSAFLDDAQLVLRRNGDTSIYHYFTTEFALSRPRLRMLPATGFVSDTKSTSQSGIPTASGGYGISIPWNGVSFSYAFYATATYIHIIIKFSGGEYQYASIGIVEKFDGVNNGQFSIGTVNRNMWTNSAADYNDTSNDTAHDRYMHNIVSGNNTVSGDGQYSGYIYSHISTWVGFSSAAGQNVSVASSTIGNYNSNYADSQESGGPFLRGITPQNNSSSIITPLLPVYLIVPKSDRVGWVTPYGVFPGIKMCWTEGYEEDEEITIGTEKYVLYPAKKTRRITTGKWAYTRYLGMAIKSDE